MNEERIKLTDTPQDILMKMAEGNPGAATVLTAMFLKGPIIDPDCAMGMLMPILHLDSMGIYGSQIWVLYKDVCGESVSRMLALLRACQMGFVDQNKLFSLTKEELSELVSKVCKRLPSFKVEPIK